MNDEPNLRKLAFEGNGEFMRHLLLIASLTLEGCDGLGREMRGGEDCENSTKQDLKWY